MKELVLGGEGLIGKELTGYLRSIGHEVSSCDLTTGCDARALQDQAYMSCDRIWFLAWDSGGATYMSAKDNQHRLYSNNSELALRVFDALGRAGTPFLFVTSQLAGQRTAYGLTKLLAETWAGELGGKVARLWNVYGWEHPSEKSHLVTDQVFSALIRGRVACATSGTERRRLLYKSDCARALVTLFDGPESVVDVAGPEWLSVRSIAEEIARQVGVPAEFGEEAGDEVMIDPRCALPGWEPTISLTHGISFVIGEGREFMREHGGANP